MAVQFHDISLTATPAVVLLNQQNHAPLSQVLEVHSVLQKILASQTDFGQPPCQTLDIPTTFRVKTREAPNPHIFLAPRHKAGLPYYNIIKHPCLH